MKTTIKTKTAGQITIDSEYIGDTKAPWATNNNYHNNKVVVTCGKKRTSFDFWGSIMDPEINSDYDSIHALYCFLTDATSGEMELDEFAKEFEYTSISECVRVHKVCVSFNRKAKRVFDCDIYDLVNEIQETYNV